MCCWCVQILVKKSYGDKKKRHRKRNWKLKGLEKDVTGIDQGSLNRLAKCVGGMRAMSGEAASRD